MQDFIPIVNRHHRIVKARRAIERAERRRLVKDCLSLAGFVIVLSFVIWCVLWNAIVFAHAAAFGGMCPA